MASNMDKLAKELKKEITASDERKPKPYDTQAEVVRVENGTAWVHIPGGVDETPVNLTISAKKGDMVNVHVAGGSAWITGNGTRPPTDDSTANYAVNLTTEVQKNVTVVENMVTDSIEANNARFGNVEADTAKIHNLTADQLSATVGYISDLTADNITAADIAADHATLEDLDVESMNAAVAYIGDLTAGNVTANDIIADHAVVDDLDVQSINAATGYIGALTAGNVTANDIIADHETVEDLDATYATIDELHANYAEIDLANVNNAWIQNGVVKDAAITDAQIIGVSANKLTAGTIDASNITVTNLNADNITTGTINGQRIGTGSLSLDKLSEDVYTEAEVNTIVDGLNDRIDGAIETFTGTVVPTLNNYPASSWGTTELKDQHIGDVYYVVNSQSQQNGYCYRFTKSGNTYSWQLIKDSDVTAALSRLETAEGKIGQIETFDQTMATFKTETEGNISTLQTKTTNLETSLGDKVDTTTFNELSQTVDGNSSSITTLSTIASNNGLTTSTNITNTVNSVSQTANGNSSKISNLTQTLGTNADGTTKTGDIVHQVSQIDQDLDGITTRVSKTEVKLAGQFATSSTASGTQNKSATITPAVTGYELTTGTTVTVKFTTANTNTAPKLNVNSTGAKPIKTYSGENLSEAEYKWPAGATMTFTYDGTNWRIQDSTELTRIKTAETSITQTATSIESLASNTTTYTKPDGTTGTNSMASAISQNASDITLKVSKDNVIAEINASTETSSGSAVKISADKVNIEGAAIFTSGRLSQTNLNNAYDAKGAAATAKSEAISTASADATSKANAAQSAAEATAAADATSKANQALADSKTYVDGKGYQTASDVSNAISGKADKTDAVSEEQYIYISKASGTSSVSKNNTWVTRSDDVQNTWTTKRPTYNTSYPVLFVAKQKKVVSGTVTCTTPIKDDTTTVIDGGHITTGTIDAARLNVSDIIASGSIAVTSDIPTDISDLNNDSGFITSADVPTKVSDLTNDSGFQTASQVSTAVSNGVSGKADKTDAIARTQRIYYRKTSSGAPSKNTTWLSTSGTGYGNWSLKIPQLTSGTTKYPYLYTAVQTQTVSQKAAGTTCTCSDVLLDDTITIIDGGTIITGTVNANAVNASSGTFDVANIPNLNASKITAGDIAADRMKTNSITAINSLTTGKINAARLDVGQITVGDLSDGSSYSTTSQMNTAISTAKSEAISAAASDASSKASTAKSEAISAAASDATTKANNAAKTATNYISPVSNADIFISPQNQSPTASAAGNSVRINGSGMEVFKGDASVAKYGDTSRVGESATRHIEISDGGLQVYQDANTVMAHLGYGSGNSESGTATAPYVVFGTAKSGETLGNYSVSEGVEVAATSYCSHAEGWWTTASGYAAHAEGYSTTASADYAHAEGFQSVASKSDAHAEGNHTQATNGSAHAEGNNTTASGLNSHAEGRYTVASGMDSHAGGWYTVAASSCQTAIGKYNANDASNAFEIGWGTSDNARKNIFAVGTDGTVKINDSNMVDFVVTQGSSTTSYGDGYWRWREWKSGKVEIWYHGSMTLNSATSQAGGLYRREKWFNFPNSYSLNRCTVVVDGMNGGGWCGCGGVQNSSSTTTEPYRKFEIMAYRISSAPDQSQAVNVYICGEKAT